MDSMISAGPNPLTHGSASPFECGHVPSPRTAPLRWTPRIPSCLGQIGPGTTVAFHGTITSALHVQGDGVRNHHIVIRGNTMLGSQTGAERDLIKLGDASDVLIEGNYLAVRKASATADPTQDYHADVIQAYRKGGSAAGYPSNWRIQFNLIELDSANPYHRSWLMLEDMAGSLHVSSNVFLGSRGGWNANGLSITGGHDSLNAHVLANTFAVKDGPGNVIALRGQGSFTFHNNLVYSASSTATIVKSPLTANLARSHNLYAGGALFAGGTCRDWLAGEVGSLCETDPLFVDLTESNSRLQPGSPAIDAGIDVGVTRDMDGYARPQGAGVDIGAYEFAVPGAASLFGCAAPAAR